jgi:rubrerythrin
MPCPVRRHKVTPEAFVAALESENRALLDSLAKKSSAGEAPGTLSVKQLLRIALKNEFEAMDLAAAWCADTKEPDAKLALARQAGDEAKHYRWIEERLRGMGDDLSGFEVGAPSPMLNYLKTLTGTVERAAAGQFTREAVAVARNEVFADFCEERGDHETAVLYRERINPDEKHHNDLGRRLLLRYATTDALQAAARAAAKKTLNVADEVQEMARMKLGVCRAPGC